MEHDTEKVLPAKQHNNEHGKATSFQDEVRLSDCLRVLRNQRYLILLGTLIPVLAVFLFVLFGRQNYQLTFYYDNLNTEPKAHEILLRRFYSKTNMDCLIDELRSLNLHTFASDISSARRKGRSAFEDNLAIKPWTPATDAKAQLLKIRITAASKELGAAAALVQQNFEKVLPVHSLISELRSNIRNYKGQMADIEEQRFARQLELKTYKNLLAKIRTIKPWEQPIKDGGISLQFDVGDKSQYLPLDFQIHAAQTRIYDLQENLNKAELRFAYFSQLVELNQRLLSEARKHSIANYTIDAFLAQLVSAEKQTEEPEIRDYLNAFVKNIENRISLRIPVVDAPEIYIIPKGIIRKTLLTLVSALAFFLVAAFLIEGVKRNREQPNQPALS